MKIWHNQFLMEPLDNGGSGSGSGLVDVWEDGDLGLQGNPQTEDTTTQTEQTTQVADGQPLTATTVAAQPAFNSGEFGTAMADALLKAGVVAPAQKPAPVEMSDEDFQKITHYYKVPAEQVTALFGNPPDNLTDEEKNAWIVQKQQALQGMLDGAVKHPIAVSRLAAQTDMQRFQQQVSPILAERAKADHTKLLTELSAGNTVLAGMANGMNHTILDIAIKSLRSENFQPQNEAQARQAIYNRVEQLGKVSSPNFSLNISSPTRQANTATRTGGMTSSVNSGGGGGQRQGGGQPKNALVAAYD